MPRKEELPQGKTQVVVLLPEDVYKKALEYAINKYGKVHGSLSKIVEEALREYTSKTDNQPKTQ